MKGKSRMFLRVKPRTVMDSFEDAGSSHRRNCSMSEEQRGQFELVAILRIIMACLGIMGALSITVSAMYRKTVCNPKVHPIFVLSVVDAMLSIMWITGSVVWLKDGANASKVGCFSINLLTVILQCVAMNVTLIYALLAYSSIRQRLTSGLFMDQSRHVWPPLCSFSAYFIAWTLPCVMVLTPFGILSAKFKLISDAKNYSCWCLPFYGNVLPRPSLGYDTDATRRNDFLHHLHYHVASYSVVLTLTFAIVFLSMVFVYCKVFYSIKNMTLIQERNKHFGAVQATILEAQKDARKRVLLFLSIFFVTGITTFILGVAGIVILVKDYHPSFAYSKDANHRVMNGIFVFLVCEGALVPLQGFLNAVVYGWTRGDFLSVMSTRPPHHHLSETLNHSYGSVSRTERDEEREDTHHLLISGRREEMARDLIMTPGTPEHAHTQ